MLNISETNGDIFNGLHGPLTRFSMSGIFEVEYITDKVTIEH